MSDETLPMNVSETLRIGIHTRLNSFAGNIAIFGIKNIIEDRDEIEKVIEYLEEHGTACSTTSVRRGLANIDRMIANQAS